VSVGSPSAASPLILLHRVSRLYRRGIDEIHALEACSLRVERGRFVAFMGPSGSGKSTLLNLVSGIDRPTSGEVWVAGQELNRLTEDELARWRARHVGLIFQFFNLVPVLSARDNVALPLLLTHFGRSERQRRAEIALRVVGLEERHQHLPRILSGGEQQRVAIARALVNRPSILLADEPTGNLDSHTSIEIMEIFQNLNDKGLTIVLVTHEHDISQFAKRVLIFRDGRIRKDEPLLNRPRATEVLRTLPTIED